MMRSLRRKISRMIMIVVALTTIYVISQMGDPEYVPAPGWVIATFTGGLATLWASQYCEWPGFPVIEEKEK